MACGEYSKTVSMRCLLTSSLLLLAGLGGLCVVIGVASRLPGWRLDYESLHAVLQTLGSMMGLGIAGFILMRRQERGNKHLVWLACSAMVMAILDAFAAGAHSVEISVSLRTLSQLAGGLLVAVMCLPKKWIESSYSDVVPKVIAAVTGLSAVISLLFPELLPTMIHDGRFTCTAEMLNSLGGVLFLLGVVYFADRFDTTQDTSDLLFALYCLLFGVSGLGFQFSTMWGAVWWSNSFARLAGLGVAFRHVSRTCTQEYVRLMESERTVQELASIVESSQDAVVGVTVEGNITSWNTGAETVFGYEAEDVMGKSAGILALSERSKQILNAIQQTRNGQRVEHFEIPGVRKDGGQIELSITVSPVRDNEGIICGISLIARDITERKQMQSQFIQNEKLASIGQLAAGVAHEMNSPVGFVASNFETLQIYVGKVEQMIRQYETLLEETDTSTDENLVRRVESVTERRDALKIDFILEDIGDLFEESKEGLARVTEIVRNLRDFSRIDQNRKIAEFDINNGIKTTLIVARNEIKYHADVVQELGEIPPTVCNSGQINQVLLNILVNAAQAIRDQDRLDRGTITVRTRATSSEIVIEIEDDGPGIPPDKLPRIFDAFFTTKPVGKGTGLGLSVSHDIITNKHKGRLLVESEPGRGTTFTIRLPIIRKSESEDEGEISDDTRKNCIIC